MNFFKNSFKKAFQSFKFTKEDAFSAYLITVTFIVVNQAVVGVTHCSGPSMEPTLKRSGTLTFIDRFSYSVLDKDFEKGDVVILISPTDPRKSKCICNLSCFKMRFSLYGLFLRLFIFLGLCKRVAGTAGEYVFANPKRPSYRDLVRIPDGHVWVLGDNLNNSNDSRYFGPVPVGLLEGRLMAKVELPFPFLHRIPDLVEEEADKDEQQHKETNFINNVPKEKNVENAKPVVFSFDDLQKVLQQHETISAVSTEESVNVPSSPGFQKSDNNKIITSSPQPEQKASHNPSSNGDSTQLP
jgi:inner membrane protease subunit 1